MSIESLLSWVKEWGAFGFLLLAFVSNAIPYSTVPYLILVAPLLSRLKDFDLVTAIIALAAGATLGKLVVYLMGRSLRKLEKISNFTWTSSRFFSKHRKPVFILVFLVAALPIPDDVFYIPIGVAKYSILSFATALFLGKIVVTALTALYGVSTTFLLEDVAGLPVYLSIPLMILVTVILTVAIGKIDWYGVENNYIEKGFLHAFTYFLKSLLKVLFIAPLTKLIIILKNMFTRR